MDLLYKRRRQKVFCIGRNKTGTTSLESAIESLGWRVAPYASGEVLLQDWSKRDFRRVIQLCKKYDGFQDIPFSLNYTFQAVDSAFPSSKFILTIRDDAEQWYQSLIRFHTKVIGKDRIPTPEDLKLCQYRHRGWLWQEEKLVYGITEANLYDKDMYITHYNQYNSVVIDYFKYRPDDLLVLNIAGQDSMQILCEFLDIEYYGQEMPHLNSSYS